MRQIKVSFLQPLLAPPTPLRTAPQSPPHSPHAFSQPLPAPHSPSQLSLTALTHPPPPSSQVNFLQMLKECGELTSRTRYGKVL